MPSYFDFGRNTRPLEDALDLYDRHVRRMTDIFQRNHERVNELITEPPQYYGNYKTDEWASDSTGYWYYSEYTHDRIDSEEDSPPSPKPTRKKKGKSQKGKSQKGKKEKTLKEKISEKARRVIKI